MKKYLILSLALAGYLQAGEFKINGVVISTALPLPLTDMASDNGGTLSAIDAYSDGVGLIVSGSVKVDNSAMNTLVYKFGEDAKTTGVTIADAVLNGGTTTPVTQVDIELAGVLNNLGSGGGVIPASAAADNTCSGGYGPGSMLYSQAWCGGTGLSSLSSGWTTLTQIGGIDLNSNNLTNLNQLSSLTDVTYGLDISYNPLTNISGLSNLKTVGNLTIDNTLLTNLSGLGSLTTINGSFSVSLNSFLSSFTGLNSLTKITGTVDISGSPLITSFAGLPNLQYVGGDIWIDGTMRNLSGLNNLTYLGGNLMVPPMAPADVKLNTNSYICQHDKFIITNPYMGMTKADICN